MLEGKDGHCERFVSADRQVQDALACCREIHHKIQSQSLAFSLVIHAY